MGPSNCIVTKINIACFRKESMALLSYHREKKSNEIYCSYTNFKAQKYNQNFILIWKFNNMSFGCTMYLCIHAMLINLHSNLPFSSFSTSISSLMSEHSFTHSCDSFVRFKIAQSIMCIRSIGKLFLDRIFTAVSRSFSFVCLGAWEFRND